MFRWIEKLIDRASPSVPDDRLSGGVHPAEKLDLAHAKSAPLDLDEVWSTAGLTGDLAAIRRLLDERHGGEKAAWAGSVSRGADLCSTLLPLLAVKRPG